MYILFIILMIIFSPYIYFAAPAEKLLQVEKQFNTTLTRNTANPPEHQRIPHKVSLSDLTSFLIPLDFRVMVLS